VSRDHERYGEDVGAYLLGALTELERSAFERHLMGCDACRDEVEWLRPAIEALPRSVPAFEAPPSLRSALMAEVERDAASQAGAEREVRTARAPTRPIRAWLGRLLPAAPMPRWAGAAALLVVGVLGGLGIGGLVGDDGANTQTFAASVETKEPAFKRASGSLTVVEDRESAMLEVRGMPELSEPKSVYEVWVKPKGRPPRPASLFEVDRSGRGSAAIPDGLEDAEEVVVTREVRGGSPVPTEAAVVRVRL
jgi:anti-sigma-K factor RskA